MACMPAMRRRAFRNHLSFRKAWRMCSRDLASMLLPQAEKFCRNTQTCIPAETPPRSLRRSVWRHDGENAPSCCYGGFFRGSLGPSPTTGNGPRRTRRLRFHLSTERDPFAFQYDAEPVVPQKFCRLTPPAQGRVKPSSDGRGGGGQKLSSNGRGELCAFFKEPCPSELRHASEPASPQALKEEDSVSRTSRPSLKTEIMKMNFNVNYFRPKNIRYRKIISFYLLIRCFYLLK